MRFIPGGPFTMGSEHFYPEEAPLRQVRVDGFWIDAAPVTNRDFARFVAETGHVTAAEIAHDPSDYPGLLPGVDRAGSLVFRERKSVGQGKEVSDRVDSGCTSNSQKNKKKSSNKPNLS